jgi:hypothetical protein
LAKIENEELDERADFGSETNEEPASVDVEREPMPDTATEMTSSSIISEPPVRSGPGSETKQKPAEGSDTSHTAHKPPPHMHDALHRRNDNTTRSAVCGDNTCHLLRSKIGYTSSSKTNIM